MTCNGIKIFKQTQTQRVQSFVTITFTKFSTLPVHLLARTPCTTDFNTSVATLHQFSAGFRGYWESCPHGTPGFGFFVQCPHVPAGEGVFGPSVCIKAPNMTTYWLSPCDCGQFHWTNFARAYSSASKAITGICPGFRNCVALLHTYKGPCK